MLLKRIYRRIEHEISKRHVMLFYILKYRNSDVFNDINIETTTLCNRRCGYCPNSSFDRSIKQNERLMPEDLFKKIIDELKTIKFTGRISPHLFGEPLLDKRIVRLMKYAHETLPKAKLKMYTNADLLDINMLGGLCDAGVKDYVVSLHGTDKEKEINKNRVDKLVSYIREEGMNINISYFNVSTDSFLANRGGLVKVKNVNKVVSCQRSTNPLVVDYKGDVLICCNDYLGQVNFGNIANNSLLNIWNSKKFKSVRNDLKKKIYKFDICKKCALQQN